MSEEPRTGASPADSETAAKPAFDLSALLEEQLSEGLSILRHAAEIAGDYRTEDARDRNGAMSAAARLMLANARLAETLARFRNTDSEKVVRQIVEVKRAGPKPATLPAWYRPDLTEEENNFLCTRPSQKEYTRRLMMESKRILEGRPADMTTTWLEWYREQEPLWDEVAARGRGSTA